MMLPPFTSPGRILYIQIPIRKAIGSGRKNGNVPQGALKHGIYHSNGKAGQG